MSDNKKKSSKKKVNWFKEITSSFGAVGRVFSRFIGVIVSIVLTIVLIGAICGIIVGATFVVYLSNYIDSDVAEFNMMTTDQDLTTIIYYQDDEGNLQEVESGRLYSSQNRVWVKYSDIPQDMIDAYVAIEDKRFYDHDGVDWKSTGKIAIKYLLGREERGASTITQQLIKNITGDDDHTVQRKVQEIFRALNLEKSKSKEEILEMYLNTIYLSQGCYGVQAASYKYFGKPVDELSLVEITAIAGISQFPTKWDPILNPNNNKERRQVILNEMLDQGKITQEEHDRYYYEDLVIYTPDEDEEDEETTKEGVTSWYVDAVIEDTIDLLMKEYNVNETAATQMLYSGGLSIVTAMKPEVQSVMEEIFADDDYINELVAAPEGIIQPESAMVILDPYTGNVLGLVGGRGKKTISRGFNYATMARRQPGSSIKPLAVYSPALEAGVINSGTVFDDVPQQFLESYSTTGELIYTAWPTNSPATYGGLTTVADGLARSVNTIAVQVLDRLGLDKSFTFLTQKLHISSLVYHKEVNGTVYTDLGLASLGLGGLTYGVSVYELVNGYTIFPNDGVWVQARTVLEILDEEGNTVIRNVPESEIALSVETAAIMRTMLHEVMEVGTGKSISLRKEIYCCGKTGTTSKNYDRWFVGFSKYYLGGVWFGYENQQKLSAFSGNPSLKIWNAVMSRLHENIISDIKEAGEDPMEGFEIPSSVIKVSYCRDSGLLADAECQSDPRGDRIVSSYFTRDNMPTTYCDTHVSVKYCTEGEAVASEYCPDECCKTVSLLKVDSRNFPIQVAVTDAQYTFRELPIGKVVCKDATEPFYSFTLREISPITGLEKTLYSGLSNYSSGKKKTQYNKYCAKHYNNQPYGQIWFPDEYNAYIQGLIDQLNENQNQLP